MCSVNSKGGHFRAQNDRLTYFKASESLTVMVVDLKFRQNVVAQLFCELNQESLT